MNDAAALVDGGWTVWDQLFTQVAAVVIAIVYAGLGTLGILFVINKFKNLRASDNGEMKGLDSYYHGERGYGMNNPN